VKSVTNRVKREVMRGWRVVAKVEQGQAQARNEVRGVSGKNREARFDAPDAQSFRAFGAGLEVEFDGVAFDEGAVSLADDGGVMDEDVLAAVAADEAEAFGVIEPFDLSQSVGHGRTPRKPPLCKRPAAVAGFPTGGLGEGCRWGNDVAGL
jgi:hypothetical protein